MGQPIIHVDESTFGLCYNDPNCKLYCGRFLGTKLPLNSFDLVVTSPPYNIGSKAKRDDKGRQNGGYDRKSFGAIRDYPDNMPESEYQEWQHDVLCRCGRLIKDNGVVVYNHKERHRDGRLVCPNEWFPKTLVLHESITWDRGNTLNWGKRLLAQLDEKIYVFKKDRQSKYYFSRGTSKDPMHTRTNIWRFNRANNKNKHCAPFPVEIPTWCIKLWCDKKGKVLDPFLGSGTSMIAALNSGCRFVGVELMIDYVMMSIERLKEHGFYKERYDLTLKKKTA